MARAALGWTLDDLAAASGVKIRETFEARGVLFIDRGGVMPPQRS